MSTIKQSRLQSKNSRMLGVILHWGWLRDMSRNDGSGGKLLFYNLKRMA